MNFMWIALAVLSLALPAQTQAPTPAPPVPTTGTASIAGTVVNDEERAAPVRRAVVTMSGQGLVPSRSAITDDDGRFLIERLPAGRFTVSVSRASFVTSIYGAKRPGKPGTPVAIAAGQRVTGLSVKIWRGAVIAGVVRTEDGQPAAGLPVRVIAARQSNEPSIFTLDNNGMKTNDAGEFRIFGLSPGTYLVSVTPPVLAGMPPFSTSEAEMDAALAALRTRAPAPVSSQPGAAAKPNAAQPNASRSSGVLPPDPASLAPSRPFNYSAIYFPGTANMSQATPITVVAGQIVDNADLQLQRVPTASVGGVVTLPDGAGASGVRVQMTQTAPPGYTLDAPLVASAATLPDGRFRIPAVGPGDYTVMARATPAGAVSSGRGGGPALWSEQKLSVSGNDIGGVSLSLESGPALTGRISFAGGSSKPPADLTQLRVSLVTPASLLKRGLVMGSEFNPAPPMPLNADGTFEIGGIPPGGFLFQITGPGVGTSGWWTRSMTPLNSDGDLLDRLIQVRPGSASMNVVLSMSDRHTELSGALSTSTGQPAADVFVIAFSTDRTTWGQSSRRVRAVRPGADGHYSIVDLPPGDYLLGVVTDVDPEDVQSLALLEQLAATSARVTIGEGEKKVQNLQLGRVGG